jgi:hypothetical protein
MFTVLISGLCAFVTTLTGGDYIAVGRIEGAPAICRVRTMVRHQVKMPMVGGHTYEAEIGEHDAVLIMDGIKYTIPRRPRA